MNKIELIKEDYNVGDPIRIECSLGIKEGYIVEFKEDRLKIRPFEEGRKPISIAEENIGDFEEAFPPSKSSIKSCPPCVTQTHNLSNQEQVDNTPKEIIGKIDVSVDNEVKNSIQVITEKPLETQENSLEPSNIQTDTIIIDKPQSNKPKDIIGNYKPGDVIPLEVLKGIDPSVDNKKRIPHGPKQKLKVLGSDFSALEKLVADTHEIDNKKLVPAMGEIKFVKPEMNFGFISDGKTGKDLYFSLNEVVDQALNISTLLHASVVYSIVEEQRGLKAIAIHKAKTISELINLAQSLVNKEDPKRAILVLEHVLSEYSDNFSAGKLYNELKKAHPQIKQKEYSNAYAKAKKYHDCKNFDKAIEFYKLALSKGEKVESSVKDLGMLYAQMYKSTENDLEKEKFRRNALDFMEEYEAELGDTVSSLYYLENFYYSVKAFDEFIEIINLLVEEQDVYRNRSKHATLLAKKAAAYLQMHQKDDALEALEEALSVDSNNGAALKLKNILENPLSENISDAVSFTDFESLNSGLSPYIQYTLDNYNEFVGVPAKVIESGDFNKTTLKGIRGFIESFSGRARERAKYLLTECKLMTMLEPDNTFKLRSELARYCNDMAKNHISNNSRSDIVRFYYNESFSLESRWDATARQVSYYLLTYCRRNDELLKATSSDISIDTVLAQVFNGQFDAKVWEGVLTMFMNNSEISFQIINKLFSNDSYKSLALRALSSYGISINANVTKEQFASAWNKAREIRTNDYKKAVTSIKIIGEVRNIEELTDRLPEIIEIKKDWMGSLDASRIHNIVNNIVPALDTYRKVSGYRNKESNRNNANGLIQQILDEINEGPTKLSYEALLPLMEKAQTLLQDSFEEVVQMSEPRLNINLLSAETVVDEDRNVSIQIAVSNHKDSSPIREVSLTIKDTDDLTFVQGDTTAYNAIEGGDELIFKLKVKVSKEVMQNKASVMTAICNYKNGDSEKSYQTQLSLRLYSSDEFTPIENPYAPIADGGPVPVDSNMFYGREEFIGNIVDAILKSKSKQVIIYGQKRCGKSSVLLHLKKQLVETGQTFCASFSLGDIVNNLSEASFYYKILSVIKEELEFAEFDNSSIPSIDFPSWNQFKEEDSENPLNTFTKYLTKFKLECKRTHGWESKKLVVLIDEFTYLYSGIKHGHISESIMKQWKAVTQNERAQFSVVLVGQDVVPSFKKEDYASNAFGVIQDIRLTYLQDEPARSLIEKPILNEKGESRYIGNAVSKIIEWTSRNPYYIQIFCARLVDTMNRNKSISVTEADVNEVAKTFVQGSEALSEDKFDNLIRAGESEDLQEYSEEHILAVLRQIALNSKNIGYCKREDICALDDKMEENDIVKHLYDREVLEKKGEDNYRIQVKLFQEWLLNH